MGAGSGEPVSFVAEYPELTSKTDSNQPQPSEYRRKSYDVGFGDK